MNRRSFLSTILLTATAPAIVRASSLMLIVPPRTQFEGWEYSYDGVLWTRRMPEYTDRVIYLNPGHWRYTTCGVIMAKHAMPS